MRKKSILIIFLLFGFLFVPLKAIDLKTAVEDFTLAINWNIDSLFSFYEDWNRPPKSPFRFPDRSYLGLKSEYKDVGIDASYYIYKPWSAGSLAEYSHFWHKIYFYWKPSETLMLKVGLFDLNFGLKFDSTWWMSLYWPLGIEEPYDTGVGLEYHGKETPINLYVSYFRDKEGTYYQPNTYDPAPGTGENDIFVGRLMYPFPLSDKSRLELGLAGYHGVTPEADIEGVTWSSGSRTMFNADLSLFLGDNITMSAQLTHFKYTMEASDGSKWLPMSGFGMPNYYSTPLEATTFWLDGFYKIPLSYRFLQSVALGNNFSAIMPKDGENIYQNVLSLQLSSVSVYTWIEWIMYKDLNVPNPKWNWYLTIIIRYSL